MSDFAPEFTQDPDAVLDYTVSWEVRLGGSDEIASSTWTVSPGGLSIEGSSQGADSTTVWLGGGTLGLVYTVVNRVTTTGGQTHDQTFYVFIEDS